MQQFQSKGTEAWESRILLMQEVDDVGEIAQHNKIITEGIGDAAISMPSSFTSYISRHHTEARATLVHFLNSVVCMFRVFTVKLSSRC